MAVRRPLVTIAGQTQELPAADTTPNDINPNNVLSRWGLVAATAYPALLTGASTYATSFYSLQRVFVPAGVAIAGVAAVVRTASGTTASTGQTGFAVYEITNSTTCTLAASTTTDATLFGTLGWRRKALGSTVAAQSVGREVYVGVACSVTATAPAFSASGIGAPSTQVDGTAMYMATFTGSALSSWTSTITYTSLTNDTAMMLVGLY